METPDIASFIFAPSSEVDYLPGQFLIMDLQFHGDPRGSLRSFSISSSPAEERSLMISTRIWSRLSQSPFKKQLHNLIPGDKVRIRAPFGKFILERDP